MYIQKMVNFCSVPKNNLLNSEKNNLEFFFTANDRVKTQVFVMHLLSNTGYHCAHTDNQIYMLHSSVRRLCTIRNFNISQISVVWIDEAFIIHQLGRRCSCTNINIIINIVIFTVLQNFKLEFTKYGISNIIYSYCCYSITCDSI